MSSSQSSSRSPGEESYFTAEEDDHSGQAPTVAESTVTATPNGRSDSLYTTAHQTPIASPSMSRGIISSIPITVQNQNSSEALRGVEESRVERRERASSTVTAAPRGSSFSHRDKASTHLEKQRASVTQQAKVREPKIDLVEYGISVAIPEKEDDTPDSPTAKALDEFSRLWPPRSAPGVNDSRPTSPADNLENNYTERREASDVSYPYRPTHTDLDPQPQTFLPSSPPSNNTSPLVSDRTTDTHQGLEPIEESDMPYEYPSGKFIMNPEAPVFVPGQKIQPAINERNPHDWVYYGVPQAKPGQVPAAPTNTPSAAIPPSKAQLFGSGDGMFTGDGAPRKFSYRVDSTQPSKHDLQRDFTANEQHPQPAEPAPPFKVPLFGSGHGMFLDPATGMFTGDGAPRQLPYRADGTLPSKPDLQRDFFANVQHPQPAEDQLHIQSKREVTKRLANFGKNGPVQRFRLGGPMPQGNQQATRVMMPKEGDGGVPIGRRMYTADEMEADLARLATGTGTGEKTGVNERDFGAKEGEAEEENKKKKEFEGTIVQDFAIRKGKGRYAGAF